MKDERNRELFSDLPNDALERVPRGTRTDKEIESVLRNGCGFTRAILASWGVPWPPPKGWRTRLTGRD